MPTRPPPGLLLILSAPSGCGKTTLAHKLLEKERPRGSFSVSYTTRAPRGKEQDGVDYHFVDEPSFRKMIEKGEFLEWAEVHGKLYGSHKSTVEEARAGKLVAFDIDVQGGNQIKEKHPEAVSVFVLPPSMEELERRLRDRKTDAEEVIQKRLVNAREEIASGSTTYDYLLVNDDLDRAFDDLCAIVRAECMRRGRITLEKLGVALPGL
ncbi:MAG: guanylate kinase [Myxococcales bacterium]